MMQLRTLHRALTYESCLRPDQFWLPVHHSAKNAGRQLMLLLVAWLKNCDLAERFGTAVILSHMKEPNEREARYGTLLNWRAN